MFIPLWVIILIILCWCCGTGSEASTEGSSCVNDSDRDDWGKEFDRELDDS